MKLPSLKILLKGWKDPLDPSYNGLGVMGYPPTTEIELTIRPYYDDAIDPPG